MTHTNGRERVFGESSFPIGSPSTRKLLQSLSMKKYRKAVAALVLRPSETHAKEGGETVYEILLVHKPRKHDAWQLPQGGIEEGETPEQAAIRELHEETGLTVKEVLHSSTCVYAYDFPPQFVKRHKPINAGQTLCFVSFLVDKNAVVKVDDDEIDAHLWILPEKLRVHIDREEYAKILDTLLRESHQELAKHRSS